MLNSKSRLLGAIILSLSVSSLVHAQQAKPSAIGDVLSKYTLGNDPFYSKVIAPAMTLDTNKSNADRIAEFNETLSKELNTVINTFDSAGDDKKVEELTKLISSIDNDMADTADADITFVDGTPSSAVARTVLLLNRKSPEMTAKKVLDVLTSYRRSPKPSDYVWEYESAQNLTQGTPKQIEATENSWLMPAASAPVKEGEDFAVKKCRQIMGWRCGTSLYSVGTIDDKTSYFFLGSYDLKNNPDNQEFKDGRAKNQVAGSTALFVVKQSEKWVLIYGVDTSVSANKLSFTPLIQEALQKDFAMLQTRLKTDLGLDKIEDQAPAKKVKLSLKDRIAKFFLKLNKKKNKSP